ncbi:hypothetical protein [Demequina gelatinilytica]|uniref:hypothetical protein n=1 Tax=Demequina gelatinilytica TaxID=1638980 RepID=UPI0007807C48|nr:hypothetical protein [Demequina gelatinilytica]
MKIRTFATLAAGTALALAPTAASAEDYGTVSSMECNPLTVEAGAQATCTLTSDGVSVVWQVTTSGDDVTLVSVAGTVSTAAQDIVGGTSVLTFDAPDAAGTIGVIAIVDGEPVDTATITVVAADDTEGAGSGSGTDSGTGSDSSASGSDDELSSTGFDNAGLVIGAGALLVVGAGAVAFAARRRTNV